MHPTRIFTKARVDGLQQLDRVDLNEVAEEAEEPLFLAIELGVVAGEEPLDRGDQPMAEPVTKPAHRTAR